MTLAFPLLPQVTLPSWERGLEGTGLTPQLCFACLELGVGEEMGWREVCSPPLLPWSQTVRPRSSPVSVQPSGCRSPQLGLARRLAELLSGLWNVGKNGTCLTT